MWVVIIPKAAKKAILISLLIYKVDTNPAISHSPSTVSKIAIISLEKNDRNIPKPKIRVPIEGKK